jgi:hypothetical protein
MKITYRIIVLAYAIILSFTGVNAQEESKIKPIKARWASDKGFWVIQGNINHPKQNNISFFTNDGIQVYRETVNKKVKMKRKIFMRLKSMLETAVTAWERNQPLRENENLFVAARKK